MSTIQFISDDPDFMKTLSEELARDLQNAGIADDYKSVMYSQSHPMGLLRVVTCLL